MCPSTQWLVAPPVAERGATPSFTFESFVRTPDSWGSLPWPMKAVFFTFLSKKGIKCFFYNVKKTPIWVGQGRQSPYIGLILTFHFRFLFSKLPCICIVVQNCIVHCRIVVVLMNHMGREHASREKKLPMVNFLIFVHKNVYRIIFQEIKIRPWKGFEKFAFFCPL